MTGRDNESLVANHPNESLMISNLRPYLSLLALLGAIALVPAQGTTIGYQGRLNDGGVPVTGLYDFTFNVFDVEAGGDALAAVVPIDAVPVTNGLFSVGLDFGPGIFTGPARWLEITVRPNGVGDPTVLIPRTPLLPVPYAIFADSAASVVNGSVAADQLNTAGIPPAPGQFLSYDGGSLTWTDPAVVGGNVFSLNGTTAYYNAGSVGLGTNDTEPGIRLQVNGNTRLSPGGSGGYVQVGTPAGETGLGVIGDNRFDLRFNGSAVKLVAGFGPGAPPSDNGIAVDTSGDVSVGREMFFGSQPRQMFNLFGTGFGIGIQTATLYSRSGGGFAWHLGGAHSDTTYDSGGGTTLMTLDLQGMSFGSRLGQHLRLWTDNAGTRFFGMGIQAATIYTRTGGNPGDGFAWHKGGFHNDAARNPGGGKTLMTLDEETGLRVDGHTSVRTLTIRGGADLAEPFPMRETVTKGSVVVIDNQHPGQLKLSDRAYDTCVAGIVSGANGINPGITLHQEGALEGGQHVALSGRVYVLADASTGAIEPGDLLTSSSTPGHAMKVSEPSRASGAILGKAMTALKDGKGTVLVLVTLQ